jgi:threonyl-tRNA synthetase
MKPEAREQLDAIRHSLAHLLATAVLDKDPGVKLAIGPATQHGFYYDFEFSKGVSISLDDLPALEVHMEQSVEKELPFERIEVSAQEARKRFEDQPYKLELIDELEKKGEAISLYKTGDFVDLCRGGHVKNTKEINPKGFMLTHTAGAYWRGDEKNTMLTRIYGVAFASKEELEAHREREAEAKKRDHRKIGKELDLFAFSNLVGSGLPLFTPRGTLMRELIVEKIYDIQKPYDYKRVWIPHIAKRDLYETSGHWEKFGDELFKVSGKSGTQFVMKPMNCPHHTQIYASTPKSYRDLPVRFVEVTTNYRDEQVGELLGLTRVRSLTQDDGHVFCTEEQIEEEVKTIITVISTFYTSLQMFTKDICWVSVSVRDPENKQKYLGGDALWEKAEHILETLVKDIGIPFERIEGEAAFYGPKLDFMFKDALGREWQLATIQLDFNMPKRFALEYTDADGAKKTPVMIHRAIAGTLERFMGIMIEHFAGAFPLWLSPIQIAILPISENHRKYAEKVVEILERDGFRVEYDQSNETLGKRIREQKTRKVPYLLVIGDKEMESTTVSVESRDRGSLGAQTIETLSGALKQECSV